MEHWSCNGEKSGSEGLSLRAEAIQVCIVPKGSTPPGSTERSFIDKSDMPQSFVKDLEISKQTNQAIIVVGNGGSYATLTLHEKVNGLWKEILRTNARVGYNGITNNKYEGDGKTPSGIYSLGEAFGVANNPGTNKNYLKLNNNHYWVDDSNSRYYNKLVNISQVNKDWNSAEHLIDNKTAYKYAININYNTNCIKNKGTFVARKEFDAYFVISADLTSITRIRFEVLKYGAYISFIISVALSESEPIITLSG